MVNSQHAWDDESLALALGPLRRVRVPTELLRAQPPLSALVALSRGEPRALQREAADCSRQQREQVSRIARNLGLDMRAWSRATASTPSILFKPACPSTPNGQITRRAPACPGSLLLTEGRPACGGERGGGRGSSAVSGGERNKCVRVMSAPSCNVVLAADRPNLMESVANVVPPRCALGAQHRPPTSHPPLIAMLSRDTGSHTLPVTKYALSGAAGAVAVSSMPTTSNDISSSAPRALQQGSDDRECSALAANEAFSHLQKVGVMNELKCSCSAPMVNDTFRPQRRGGTENSAEIWPVHRPMSSMSAGCWGSASASKLKSIENHQLGSTASPTSARTCTAEQVHSVSSVSELMTLQGNATAVYTYHSKRPQESRLSEYSEPRFKDASSREHPEVSIAMLGEGYS